MIQAYVYYCSYLQHLHGNMPSIFHSIGHWRDDLALR